MIRVVYILVIISIYSCIKKQNLEIAEPEWPRYRLYGWVLEDSTFIPLDSALVILKPVRFVFHDSIPVESTLTDEKGYYDFSYVPAMACSLRVEKYGYEIFRKLYIIQNDRRIIIYLKKPSQ